MSTTCVSYYPSEVEIQRFWDEERSREKATIDLPNGFPKELQSPLAWTRPEIEKKQSEWKLEMAIEDVEAINAALEAFEG